MLNVVRNFNGVISDDTYRKTTWHMGLTGENWRALSGVLWSFLGYTLSEDMVEAREFLAGGESQGRNGFEIWGTSCEQHGQQSIKAKSHGQRLLRNWPRCANLQQLDSPVNRRFVYVEAMERGFPSQWSWTCLKNWCRLSSKNG